MIITVLNKSRMFYLQVTVVPSHQSTTAERIYHQPTALTVWTAHLDYHVI